MDTRLRDYLEAKMGGGGYRGDHRRGDMMSRDRNDGNDYYGDSEDRRIDRNDADYGEDERDYADSRRRRSSRTGRYMRDRRDYNDDYGNERGSRVKLTKADKKRWKQMLENSDGTQGVHYDMMQIMSCAEKMNIRFDDFDEGEFCLAVNMMYSDYGHIIKKHIGHEKELAFCVEMARAFLEDPDGPEPSEKLALYFHCIVDAE